MHRKACAGSTPTNGAPYPVSTLVALQRPGGGQSTPRQKASAAASLDWSAATTGGGATATSAFCAHAAGRIDDLLRFRRGGDRAIFDTFFLSNSVPTTVAHLPKDDTFVVLDLLPQVLEDLDA